MRSNGYSSMYQHCFWCFNFWVGSGLVTVLSEISLRLIRMGDCWKTWRWISDRWHLAEGCKYILPLNLQIQTQLQQTWIQLHHPKWTLPLISRTSIGLSLVVLSLSTHHPVHLRLRSPINLHPKTFHPTQTQSHHTLISPKQLTHGDLNALVSHKIPMIGSG